MISYFVLLLEYSDITTNDHYSKVFVQAFDLQTPENLEELELYIPSSNLMHYLNYLS